MWYINRASKADPEFASSVHELLQSTSRNLILVTGVAYLIWHVLATLTWPDMFLSSIWYVTLMVLMTFVPALWLLPRNLIAAQIVWQTGLILSITISVFVYQQPEIAFLYVFLPLIAVVTLGWRGGLVAEGIIITLVWWLAESFTMLPQSYRVAIILGGVFAGLLGWAVSNTLLTVTHWSLFGFKEAQKNLDAANKHRGEVVRVLKSLDHAYYQLEHANQMLISARNRAEEASRLKQQFAQTISHELRTPLNLIVGFTELMTQSPEYYGGQLPPTYLRDLTVVYRNACHLQNLVNDVLDLARIEAVQMSLLPEETAPSNLVQEAVDTARSLVEARGLKMYTNIAPNLPQLWLDPTRIRQVLFNLLNNAARFTEEGNITVNAYQAEEGVVFSVADTGVGIASEDIPRLFEEFHQLDGSTRRRHGGAGLGLAISRRFVELHEGRMWVESQVGEGSTFYFCLPVAHDELVHDESGRSAHTTSLKTEDRPVLLTVTASPAAAGLLTRYVRGCRTIVVPDLDQAQRATEQLIPQAVVIDQACGTLSQIELKTLAHEWGLSQIPFMICPLPGEEPLRQRLAVDGYLIKPVSRQSLWDMLHQFGEAVDRILVIDDDRDFVSLLNRMLISPTRNYRVTSAYSGWEGLDLVRRNQPDLILLDMVLSDMMGTQVVERIRENPRWRQIPIVIVSGEDEVDYQETVYGEVTIAKTNGLMPGEVVQWVQHMVDGTMYGGLVTEEAR